MTTTLESLTGFDAAEARLRLRRMRALRTDRDREVFLSTLERTEGHQAREQAAKVWQEEMERPT
jgi:hypothetical protein